MAIPSCRSSALCLPSGTGSLWNQRLYLPLSQSISLNMAVKKNSTKPVDPSNFLWALKHKLSNIRGVPFEFNTQQDVAEILKGVSLAASHLISNTKKQFLAITTFFPLC